MRSSALMRSKSSLVSPQKTPVSFPAKDAASANSLLTALSCGLYTAKASSFPKVVGIGGGRRPILHYWKQHRPEVSFSFVSSIA